MSFLYPYQEEAVHQMKNGCILCGGVGSGKSRTALYYYFCKVCGGGITSEDFKPMTNPVPLYIITTAKKRDSLEWEKELSPFLLSASNATSYAPVVQIDSWNNIKKYLDVTNSFFIFDEQRVVGSGAWARTFIKIAKKNQWILLSATPGDTWMDYIPVFIANGFYKSWNEFLTKHAVYNRFSKYPKVDKYIGIGKLYQLRNDILVNMDYKKKTVSHENIVKVEYNKEDYKQTAVSRWNQFTNEPILNASEYCSVLRKIVNSDESRVDEILRILTWHPKAIIFYNYDYELAILKSIPYEEGTQIAELNGHRHDDIPSSDRWVYLVQYLAGAEGWNCTLTDTMIFYSQSYSYRMMTQAAGRIDRLNSPFTNLYYYYLRSSAPIDLEIARCIKRKKNFNESSYEQKRFA